MFLSVLATVLASLSILFLSSGSLARIVPTFSWASRARCPAAVARMPASLVLFSNSSTTSIFCMKLVFNYHSLKKSIASSKFCTVISMYQLWIEFSGYLYFLYINYTSFVHACSVTKHFNSFLLDNWLRFAQHFHFFYQVYLHLPSSWIWNLRSFIPRLISSFIVSTSSVLSLASRNLSDNSRICKKKYIY